MPAPPETNKIAFCFLIRKNLNQLELWEKFFKTAQSKSQYKIYFHVATKEGSDQEFVKKHTIKEFADTKWGGNLYNAVTLLYKNALKDKCYKYCLLSESHVPLRPFPYVYKHLTESPKSHMYYQTRLSKSQREVGTNAMMYSRFVNNMKRCSIFAKNIDIKHWYFNEMWTILNKKHVKLIINDTCIQGYLQNAFAWDENYPMYMVSLNDDVKNVINEKNTFVDWKNAVEHKPGQRSPSEFTKVTDDFIEDLQYTPSMLFARKFTEKSNVCDFTSTVLRVD
jgi:hypothetical protein